MILSRKPPPEINIPHRKMSDRGTSTFPMVKKIKNSIPTRPTPKSAICNRSSQDIRINDQAIGIMVERQLYGNLSSISAVIEGSVPEKAVGWQDQIAANRALLRSRDNGSAACALQDTLPHD
jgi:hypothetical protein